MLRFAFVLLLLSAACSLAAALGNAETGQIDLSRAVVAVPPGLTGPENKAVAMLVEEVFRRTRLTLPIVHAWPAEAMPVIAVGPAAALRAFVPHGAAAIAKDGSEKKAEGYRLRVQANGASPVVLVAGNDARGVLFGAGGLLRSLHMDRDRVAVPADLNVTTAPRYPLRGHQLGYRPKTNSYDAWSLPVWEQYIRDLAVFGTNAVELIPPRSDDDADSPHFPLPPMEMMVGMSRLLDDYGLDVWIWYPAMDRSYDDPKTVEAALAEWGEVFRKLPRIDAVFVPGGDPGHTEPKYLLALLEKQTQSLHRTHPKAQMWVSPQGFNKAWMDEFLGILQNERPVWLTGIVFGPQVRIPLPQLRALVPKQYLIRRYPDITHSKECQYPPPDWDVAYAFTENRESINPRPREEAQIVRALQQYAIGSISYSEGCNDDVNKIVWSALDWNPDADVTDILRDYGRYFIGDRYADAFAQGLLGLERNWQGPLLTNEGVTTTLRQFQDMERTSTPQMRRNWRFQQALYRAYYDAYLRSRLLYEQGLEDQAMEVLRGAGSVGSLTAMNEAEAVLDRAVTQRIAGDLRARVFELAEALFQSIGMQLSVPRYDAIAEERGANLDGIDKPLNNRLWLKERFAALRQMPQEADRLKGIAEIVHWTDPGPGGFYDELGNLTRREHLIAGPSFAEDPGCYERTRIGFSDLPGRLNWARHVETLYDTPIQMRYTHLDPNADYKVRVVYGGDDTSRRIRLVAGDNIEIHPLLTKPMPARPLEFDIPRAAIKNGELLLSWTGMPGIGGNGRGCQVSEVWLIRKDNPVK